MANSNSAVEIGSNGRLDLVSFLGLRSWKLKNSGTIGELWESKSGRQVGVPYEMQVGSSEWHAIMERLAVDSKLPVQTITDSIRGMWMDTFEFRASSDIYIQDTIPAKAGADFFRSIWRMLRSAATTSRTPKAQISGNWSKTGDAAIENARFAHTRQGSYILPLLVPLPRVATEDMGQVQLTATGNSSFHESNERRATRTMVEAVAAVHAGLIQPENEPLPSVVSELIHLGVSREFISAIHEVIRHDSVAKLDMSVIWAGRSPSRTAAPEKIIIPAEAAYRLERVVPLFKKERRSINETLTGPIYKMADRAGEPFGIATMEVPRAGRTSMVDVFVERSILTDAHDWFKDHKAVLVEGKVESTPRGLVMRNPVRFEELGSGMFFK